MKPLQDGASRSIAAEATLQSLTTDVSASGVALDRKTVAEYMSALRRVFALDELPAWSVALRSRSRLRTAPKLHLADPALACAALGVGVDRLGSWIS